MAAGFLVTLFEYSPLFYITVVSLCFFVTAAMVLGWFGFDVPVILRSSDDTESLLPTPEKLMVRTTNPFLLDLGSGPARVADGVSLRPCCLEPCVLTCFWGCEVRALQVVLQVHQHTQRLITPQHFLQALQHRYLHRQTFHIDREDKTERHTLIPADLGITDFGPLPRERYPLVAVLTLAEPEAPYDIVTSLTVIHVPDDKYSLSARVLFQYLLTSHGNMYELKPLFMSAEPPDSEQSPGGPGGPGGPGAPGGTGAPGGPGGPGGEVGPDLEQESWSEQTARDCVVCQNAAVNKVLLPCRHACVCDTCVFHFQHCPICRAFIQESFTLTQ